MSQNQVYEQKVLSNVRNPPHPLVPNQKTLMQNLKMAQGVSERIFIVP